MQILSQRDPRWANIPLGTSTTTTIGTSGCTITCLAMACGLTPAEVNQRLLNAGAYANTNLVNWTKLQAGIPWLQFEVRAYEYNNDAVKNAILKNGYCLVEVDFDGKITSPNDRHWVLYIGNGQMYDPWTGVQKATSYYPTVKGYAVINTVDVPQSSIDEYSGLDITNRESNLLTAHIWADVVKYGKYVSKADYDLLTEKVTQLTARAESAEQKTGQLEAEKKTDTATITELQGRLAVKDQECQTKIEAILHPPELPVMPPKPWYQQLIEWLFREVPHDQ